MVVFSHVPSRKGTEYRAEKVPLSLKIRPCFFSLFSPNRGLDQGKGRGATLDDYYGLMSFGSAHPKPIILR